MKQSFAKDGPKAFRLDRTGNMTRQMADGIIAAIERGQWHAGDVLPSIREWQTALRTGAYVPRAAMKTLARMGVVTVKKHVGSIVTGLGTHKWKGRVAFITTIRTGSYYETLHAHTLQSLLENDGWEFVHVIVNERFEDDSELDLTPLKRHLKHGIDLAICFTGSRQIAAELDKAGVRYIYEGGTGREFPNAEAVINLELNSREEARKLVTHWVSQKIRNVLLVDFKHVMPRILTSEIFSAQIRTRHIPLALTDTAPNLKDIQQAGMNATAKFFSSETNRAHPPDAIFFYDDYVAAGGLVALAATGLRTPEDIHVATLANKGLGPIWFNPLTRLEYDPAGNAQLVGDYIVKLLSGKKATPPRLTFKFIKGAT